MRKNILFVLGSFFSCLSVVAQGSWDLKYFPLDSLNDSFIGKELRIDFKSGITAESEFFDSNVRTIFLRRDTVALRLFDQVIRFVENWKIYADHGALSDQTLRSVGGSEHEQIIIKEIFARAIDGYLLTVDVYIYRPGSNERVGAREIKIDRSLIAGVIVSQ